MKSVERTWLNSLLRLVGWLLLLPRIAGLAAGAQAQTVPEMESPQVWLNPGTYSYPLYE